MIHNRQEYIENLINNVSTHTPGAKKESMLIDNNPLLRVLAHNILDDWDKDYSKVLKKLEVQQERCDDLQKKYQKLVQRFIDNM